jgi:hypothetical protein
VVWHQLTETIMNTSITKLDAAAAEPMALDAEASEAAIASNAGIADKLDARRPRTRQRAAQGRAADGKSPVYATVGSSKTEIALRKLRAAKGATVPMLMEATGSQAHSVRGFLSGTVRRKLGLTLVSEIGKDGARRYRVTDRA